MRFFNRFHDVEAGEHRPFPEPATSTSKKYHLPFRSPTPKVPLPPSDAKAAGSPTTPSRTIKHLDDFLAKYDPQAVDIPILHPMNHHRDMVRTMYLDNILYNTANLHKHYWIMKSQNELYKELQTPDRYGKVQDDLDRYTKSIQNYELWLTSWIQTLEIPNDALPPTFQTYGKTLAILECAALQNVELEKPFIQGVSEGVSISHFEWAVAAAEPRRVRQRIMERRAKRMALLNRIAMAFFSGAAFIVPVVLMDIFRSTRDTITIAGSFTLGMGLILAFWMTNASTKDIIAATAGYAAVLVVFVGTGNQGKL